MAGLNMRPFYYSYLIFDKDPKRHTGENTVSSRNRMTNPGYPYIDKGS